MQPPQNPQNENKRLASLCALEVLDTDDEERFDRITRLAKVHFEVEIALVSLVDSERQWFKSKQGLDACETPRSISFCGHAILSDEILYVPNALEDLRFADNPLVTGPPDIRFYAGAPLHAPNGERVGTLCIIDNKPRDLTKEQLSSLRDLANITESELAQGHLLKVKLGMKDSEESLVDYAKRLSLATKAGGIGIWEFDVQQNSLAWDDRMFELYGAQKALFPGAYEAWQQALHPDDASRSENELSDAIAGGKPFDTEFRVVWPNGEIRHIKASASITKNEAGVVQKMIGVNQDITKTKNMELAAKLYESIIQSSEDAIFSKSLNGLISSWNTGAEKMFGYTAKEIIGQSITILLPDELEQEENDIREKIIKGQSINSLETIRVTKRGIKLDISATMSPIYDERGKVSGVSTISRDISERKKLENLQSQFVSTVSHELRTPLTSINGSLGLVLGKNNDELSPKTKKLLEIAMRNGERLTLLINDILDLEKLQSDLMEFQFSENDLGLLAQQAMEDNCGFAAKHGVSLVVENMLVDTRVEVDHHRLLQVFSNLISNAVKFSPTNGQVIISISEADSGFRVSVKDSGKGIPEDFQERIFQRFAQATHTDNRQLGGSGLGLSISKAIIECHNGKIGYHTEVNKGTEFYFDLPKRQAGL